MIIIRLFRILKLVAVVVVYLIKSSFIHLTTTDPHHRRRRFAKNVTEACGRGLRALNIKVNVTNTPQDSKRYLIVCNHLGFLDIFAIASTVPTLFVTSIEMKETPLLGLLTEMGGCLYVERRSRSNIHNEIKEIEGALNNGFNVVIFPEGKSTNGEKVHPFKKSLLMACAGSEANILPAVINFRTINGEPMQHKFRDWVFWYEDLGFVEAVINASQINDAQLSLDFLNEILVNGESNHRDIAALAQNQIEEKYVGIPFPPKN